MAEATTERTIDLADGLKMGEDGIVRKGARVATAADAPVRNDLPEKHPLYRKRALRCVPAGMPDCTIDAEGRLVPIDLKTGEPVRPEPVAVERIR